MKKISVVIPVYNAREYLKTCISALLEQAGEELEIIAVDDGSTDDSLAILNAFKDPRLRIFHRENEGAFRAWQFGVRQTSGEYIAFCDADDYYLPCFFALAEEVLSGQDYDLVQFGWREENGTETLLPFDKFPDNGGGYYSDTIGEFRARYLFAEETEAMLRFPTPRWAKLFRAEKLKAFLPELPQERIDMFEDDCLVKPFLGTASSLYLEKQAVYVYRTDVPTSVSNSYRGKWRGYLRDCRTVNDYFAENREKFGFPAEFLEFQYYNYFRDLFYKALRFKLDEFAEEVVADKRYRKLLRRYDRSFLARLLLGHGMTKTYLRLRRLKHRWSGKA